MARCWSCITLFVALPLSMAFDGSPTQTFDGCLTQIAWDTVLPSRIQLGWKKFKLNFQVYCKRLLLALPLRLLERSFFQPEFALDGRNPNWIARFTVTGFWWLSQSDCLRDDFFLPNTTWKGETKIEFLGLLFKAFDGSPARIAWETAFSSWVQLGWEKPKLNFHILCDEPHFLHNPN